MRPEFRPRQEQAAIVENAAAGKRDAAAQLRQRFEHGVVPEQELQQQRNVADQFDVAAREPRHQPVVRQPRHADDQSRATVASTMPMAATRRVLRKPTQNARPKVDVLAE